MVIRISTCQNNQSHFICMSQIKAKLISQHLTFRAGLDQTLNKLIHTHQGWGQGEAHGCTANCTISIFAKWNEKIQI